MSKKRMSAATMKILEERKEIERQHLKYLRETRAKYLEKRDRMAAAVLNAGFDKSRGSDETRALVYDYKTDTYSIRDYSAGTKPYSYMPSWSGDAAPATPPIKYLTLEEAMKLHREEEARKYYTAKPGYPSTWVVETSPVVHVQKNIRVAGLSDGTYPEVGMRVMHDGVTFEIERIEIETPSWRPIAVGHAVGDTDTFTAGRLYVRAPLDELQPAKAKENVA